MPWTGDYVFSSGDLVEDLTHNFFLETGARNNKLKVYEMVDHPAARALTRLPARARRRAPGRLRAGGREAHGRRPHEAVPVAADPDGQDPRVPAAHRARRATCGSTTSRGADYAEAAAVFNGPHPETGEELEFVDDPPEGFEPNDLPPQPAVFAPGYSPEEIREIAGSLRERAGLAG